MKTTKVSLNPERVNTAWAIAHALAHPLRLRILEYIDSMGKTNVNNIYKTLQIEQSITSQHLRILRDADIVSNEKDGKFVHYAINYDRISKASSAVASYTKTDQLFQMAH